MAKIRTSELSGTALDWAVAKCEGYETNINMKCWVYVKHEQYAFPFQPSSTWAHGGPIIEREDISICSSHKGGSNEWFATVDPYAKSDSMGEMGPTPLIAAMRCYCSSNLGDEIEVPDELLNSQ